MLAWHLGAFKSDEWVFTGPEGGLLRYDNFLRRVWAPAIYGHLFDDREDELVAALDRRRSTGLERNVDQAWTR
jgi:hypothetical protein